VGQPGANSSDTRSPFFTFSILTAGVALPPLLLQCGFYDRNPGITTEVVTTNIRVRLKSLLRTKSTTENDQRPTTNDQRPMTNDQRPTTNDQRPTTNDQRPTTNDQKQNPAIIYDYRVLF